jgi:Protein of unknown function (DUF3137)
MATALRSPRAASGTPEKRLARLFRREIAPHIASLDAERARRRGQFLATLVGCALGVPALTALLWPLDSGWAVAVGVIGVAIGANVLCQQQRAFRHHLRKLVMPAICQAIGDVQHHTGEAPGVPFDALERLGLLPGHNWRRIDDAFSGRHRGTGFVMAEVLLRQRSRGSRRSRSRKVFRGLVFAIEVPREIPARILIARDSGALGNRLKGWLKGFSGLAPVPLPDPEFEARFEVYADRPEVARSTVSPSVCAALTCLADRHPGRPLQGAFQGRWFYLSMPRAGDQFRLGSLFRSLDGLQREAGQVLRDIQIVHRVIDTLHGDAPAHAAAD